MVGPRQPWAHFLLPDPVPIAALSAWYSRGWDLSLPLSLHHHSGQAFQLQEDFAVNTSDLTTPLTRLVGCKWVGVSFFILMMKDVHAFRKKNQTGEKYINCENCPPSTSAHIC